MATKPNFESFNDGELLQSYARLMEELQSRQLIRTSNNPVADYAEKVAVEYLGLRREGKEVKGYDATDNRANKYQIKGRRITKHNPSRQLSVIRNLDDKLFDFLIAVIFDEDFNVTEIWKVPHRFVREHTNWSEHQNGHIFYANPNVLSAGKGVERIT